MSTAPDKVVIGYPTHAYSKGRQMAQRLAHDLVRIFKDTDIKAEIVVIDADHTRIARRLFEFARRAHHLTDCRKFGNPAYADCTCERDSFLAEAEEALMPPVVTDEKEN
jgi:RNase adaptor protein for sRNA GlmZ degradation